MKNMRDKLLATASFTASEKKVEDLAPVVPRTAPGKIMHTHQQLARAEEELEVFRNNNKVKIADLHEVPGRKRNLTKTAFEELKLNLANNPLAHSIVVRPRKQGGFEIIAGHNRVQAYRELGFKEIQADIRDFDDNSVFEAAFYSNLFNSPLSDFEKYLGFREIQETTKETHGEMAKRAGVSREQITKIFAFERFTPAAKELLEKHPHVLGSNAAQRMTSANESRVLPALQKLIAGECTEAQAVSLALAGSEAKPAKAEPIVIRSGKRTFAEIKVNKGLVAITIKDETRVAGLLNQIQSLLENASKGQCSSRTSNKNNDLQI